jgi:two-component system, NarL family, nitrate/nitrite response regulator NarL
MPLRCLIVDDNASFLQDAAALLRRDGLVVAGVASNMSEALERARELRPDVALVDIWLGSESGLEVAQRLVEADGGALEVILISTHAEADVADLVDEAPVAGFVPKAELSGGAIRRLLDAA